MPSSAPLLTVAIPTCNGSVHLAETIHSILHQECGPFDLLVCDDRSDDETVPLVRALTGDARVWLSTSTALAWPATGTSA